MARYVVLTLLSFLVLFLQSTIFSSYGIRGVIPDLVLVLVVNHAMFASGRRSVAYGVFCGLLEDLFSARIIGINAIAKGITAFIVSRLQFRLFQDNMLVGLPVMVVGTAVNLLICFLLLYFISGNTYVNINILEYGFYQLVYNCIFAIPVYYLFYRANRKRARF
ncbi:MAG: rod shape-determining protein MreD [Syntrophomonadaceae bacterium]|nr:rod shape-determining protein MreD [Syntrophomonadaceae bacterium]